jgi:hypothetical protein
LKSVSEKMRIATVVNLLNRHFAKKRYALMGPGRWGSNDINLGVRVTYADINNTNLLVEIAFAKGGYTPFPVDSPRKTLEWDSCWLFSFPVSGGISMFALLIPSPVAQKCRSQSLALQK